MDKHPLPPPPTGKRWIFRPWKTDPRTGERLYANQYGKKAWAILVDD
jgi:hypothetical protein